MSQQQFFNLLDKVPRIAHLWDRQSGNMDVDTFEDALGVMSSGEVQIAKFFSALWFHSNKRHGFDLVDAVSSLDSPEVEIIIDWIKAPFWP